MPDEKIEMQDEVTTPDTESPLEELSNSDLQKELVKLGMPEEDVKKIVTKAILLSIINTMKGQQAAQTGLNPTVDPVEDRQVEERHKTKAHRQWDFWDSKPKVKIIVPLAGKEKQGVIKWVNDPRMKRQVPVHVTGAIQPVIENGAIYLVPKGVYVEVPEPVAKVITDKFQQISEAGANISVDRIDPETGRRVGDQL